MTKKTPMGLDGLLSKWHTSVLADIKRLRLPEPDHKCGFSSKLLKENLSKQEWTKFARWMYGQTCVVDEKLGLINYTNDVIRGLDFIRNGKATYWD